MADAIKNGLQTMEDRARNLGDGMLDSANSLAGAAEEGIKQGITAVEGAINDNADMFSTPTQVRRDVL